MPRYGQLVVGPAGSGKSTYCANIQKHCEVAGRTCHVVNLDPAAEHFSYTVLADVRELIHVEDAMEDEELGLGPNGGLVFCMEYLASNSDWLLQAIDEDVEDDYILFDCPGQIELYSHLPVMQQIIEMLQRQCDFRLCAVFLLDSQFLVEPHKFVSGGLAALSAMVALELPFVAVMSKVDLLSVTQKKRLDRFLEPDFADLLAEGEGLMGGASDYEPNTESDEELGAGASKASCDFPGLGPSPSRYAALGRAFAQLIEDYSFLRFHSFDVSDETSVEHVLGSIDAAIQFGEDREPRMRDPPDPDDNED